MNTFLFLLFTTPQIHATMKIYVQRKFDVHIRNITRSHYFTQYEMYGGTDMQVRTKMLLNP